MTAIQGGETANDRFKRSYGKWFWVSVMAGVGMHFLVFTFWPQMTAGNMSIQTSEITAVDLPPEVRIPPPPQQIARPATPVIGSANIDENVTIASTTFESNPVDMLPPPPTATPDDDISKAPVFTPMTVTPKLLNGVEVQRALTTNYPPLLRDAGIGGSPEVYFFIDEQGHVLNTVLHQSSGYDQLDKVALDVGRLMRFSPAQNRDKKVKVWVSLPITFTAK